MIKTATKITIKTTIMKKIFYIAAISVALVLSNLALPKQASAEVDWYLHLNVEAGGKFEALTIGGHVDYVDGENPQEAPAWLVGYLKAYFYEPGWSGGPYFWTDYRSAALPQEWTFYVSARYRSVKLNWRNPVYLQSTMNLELIDDLTGTAIDMRKQSSYVYSNSSTTPRRFRILASGVFTPTRDGPEAPEGPAGPPADTTAPETAITTDVPEYTASRDVSVSFDGTDNVTEASSLLFSYSVDGGGWSGWSGEGTTLLTGLTDGVHVFKVKAKDEAGNVDPTPAEETFAVDTTAPTLVAATPTPAVLWPPNGKTTRVTFSGATTDAGSGIGVVTYTLTDEYGEHSASGTVTPGTSGAFSVSFDLTASRLGSDFDGRSYSMSVTSMDTVGNETTRSVKVSVPHDRRR